ncbi:hypothetical protein SAMN04489723_10738 [Algoriphagus aquimarinus]|uniref:Uncharacterized protein n=1 Tax=Algoriphagus aquimarinus TaxID=237018 RepID=A0A1I1A225_9BACT|nr:hypothetical protein SAMN04489723_10738 [Algoriphagus aquimarinus]
MAEIFLELSCISEEVKVVLPNMLSSGTERAKL